MPKELKHQPVYAEMSMLKRKQLINIRRLNDSEIIPV
jgi:hypothetical protein